MKIHNSPSSAHLDLNVLDEMTIEARERLSLLLQIRTCCRLCMLVYDLQLCIVHREILFDPECDALTEPCLLQLCD